MKQIVLNCHFSLVIFNLYVYKHIQIAYERFSFDHIKTKQKSTKKMITIIQKLINQGNVKTEKGNGGIKD